MIFIPINKVDLSNPEIQNAKVLVCGNNFGNYDKGQWFNTGVIKNGKLHLILFDGDSEEIDYAYDNNYDTHIQFIYNPNNNNLVYFKEEE